MASGLLAVQVKLCAKFNAWWKLKENKIRINLFIVMKIVFFHKLDKTCSGFISGDAQ